MKWHKILTIVLLIIFMVGLGSFGIYPVSATAPTTPIPLSPQGDIYLCSNVLPNLELKCTTIPSATGYRFQVANVADFSSLLVDYSSGSNVISLNLNLSSGIYYWRCQAFNADGFSAWSSVLSFHVIPSPPVLVSPANNGFVLPNTPFTWTTCYPFDTQMQISNRPDFSVILIDVNFNASQYIYKGPYVYEYKFYWPLSPGMYWWRLRSKLGTEINSWVTQLFVVMIPPNVAPEIISPVQNAVLPSASVNLKWSYVNNSDRYQIQICKGNNVCTDTIVFTTSYNFLGEDNTNYCFRVRAGNPVGWGPWSGWGQFKILLPPNTPTLVSPFNRAVIQNNNIVVLDWNSIPTAASYLVEISNANTGAVQTFKVLAPYTVLNFPGYWSNTYLWKIKAKNPSGESGWSNSWMFTIQENIPPKLEIDNYPQYTNQSTMTITGKAYDLESGLDTLCLGPNSIPVFPDNTFKINFNLNEGPNSFTLIAIDKAGNKTQKTIGIIKDTTPPEIDITFPIAPIYPSYKGITVIADIQITGVIKDLLPVQLWINNQNVPIDSDSGNFVYQTVLNYGLNKIYIKAIDAAGNISEKTLIIYKTINPKFIFRINNPKIFVQVINKKGQLDWIQEEIDPGRYTVPLIVKGRVFIPVRKCVELISGTTEWDPVAKKVTITVPDRGKTIELWIGKSLARVTDYYGNQRWIQIEKGDNTVVPFIKNDRSYFPLRFIVEQMNAVVEWNQVIQEVTVEFPIVP